MTRKIIQTGLCAEKHCGAIAATADKLAVGDEKAAEFHNLRRKELQGK